MAQKKFDDDLLGTKLCGETAEPNLIFVCRNPNHELLAKLMSVLHEPRQVAGGVAGEGVVPVTIIDREGRVRGVELFKRDTDAEGESILKHISASAQYDAKPVHVLLDFGDENHVILSERVERDTLRLKPVMRRTQPLRADYFIIED